MLQVFLDQEQGPQLHDYSLVDLSPKGITQESLQGSSPKPQARDFPKPKNFDTPVSYKYLPPSPKAG